MQRRDFLKNTAVLGAGAAGLPLIAAAPPSTRPTVGHGDFQYRVDQDWVRADPTRLPVQHCHEMVLDARNRLVCSTVSNRTNVLVYSPDGKILDSWQHDLVEPHGFARAGEGSDQTFWMTDSEGGRVLQLDPDGRKIRELPPPTEHIPEGKRFMPTETTVARNGDVYVADGYGSDQIFHYDAAGKLLNVFGGPDHFDCPHGIVVDDRSGKEELLITSRANQEFQRWSMDGRHLSTRKLPGLQICRPVIHGELTLFAVIVTKSWWHYDGMVAVLDKDFNVVSLPGGSAPTDQDDFTDVRFDNRTFMNPHDVCPDGDGNLYVPQWYSGRTFPVRLRRV